MGRSGAIIRLIDVVLNVLFGFMMISEIIFYSQIKLPSKGQPVTQPDMEIEQDIVNIYIDSKVDQSRLDKMEVAFRVTVGDNVKEFDKISLLEKYLVERSKESTKLQRPFIVVLEPFGESLIQTTIDVLDICKRHNFQQSIKSMSFTR